MIFHKQLICGEMHYPRIPRAYWGDRLHMARAMGLNAISTYVFWNVHEPSPGAYDFQDENDVAAYVCEAGEAGLDVILRPGPYVCAEWDFGGLPAWLLEGDDVQIRSNSETYMRPVRTWLHRLGAQLAPLQASRGGPIVAVQLENEYGAFGTDADYLRSLRDALTDAGFDSRLYTIDQPRDLLAGSLPDVAIGVTFAPGNPPGVFRQFRDLRPDAPLFAGEYWAGWFDHWGEAHARRDLAQQESDLAWMLARGVHVNIYMFHGGTNFGFRNGANSAESLPYQPTTTSYDYDAALDEAGRPTKKYYAFRDAIARFTGVPMVPVPPPPRTVEIAEFTLEESGSFSNVLHECIESDTPVAMEALGQYFGYILYRTRIEGPADAALQLEDLRDYALVALDGTVVAMLDRRLGQSRVRISHSSSAATLDILVENSGRINYGPDLPFERKGMSRAVLNDRELRGWQIFPVPLNDVHHLPFASGRSAHPAFYRGTFTLETPADSFFDVSDLGKGVLWVNGRNAGRFWNIGPQETLYVPGVWMHEGVNEAVALDLFAREHPPRLCGLRDPRFREEALPGA